MSFNQSKSDKSDTQYRRTGRSASFNQQRNSSGTYVKGGGGGGGSTPSPSITSGSSVSTNRSFKKSYNAQGGQSRVNPPAASSGEPNIASTARTVQNGTHIQSQLHGTSDASVTNATAKSIESSAAQRSARTVPKAPTSQPPSVSSDPAAPTTPAKAPGDASRASFPFQFGSISPGFMNGMAIPARTSSAPPNLDEQKRDQALHGHNSLRPVPSMPTPPVPKQQPPRTDAGVAIQSNAAEVQSGTKAKKDPQVSPLPPLSQMQKPSVVPLTGMSMAMPYHQPHSQASIQFGGPNPQIKSQGMSTASLQMPIPMPLPIGNAASMQQQVFVPGLQPHSMHPQGIIQGQNMSFSHQMGAQMPHQLGNMGIGISPQYTQQQGGKFGGPRKTTTVKITHPETHEELRLDKRADTYSDGGSSGARSHSNLPTQSQPVQSFATSHPINYYPPSSYSTNSLFFPSANSLSITSNQMTPNSQPQRFNYPVNHSPQNVGFMTQSSLISVPVSKTGVSISEPPNPEQFRDVHNLVSSTPSGVTSVAIKPSGGSGIVDSSMFNSSILDVEKSESRNSSGASGDAGSSVLQKGSENSEISSQQSMLSSDSSASRSVPKQFDAVSAENITKTQPMRSLAALSEDSVSVVSDSEVRRKESLSRSNSLKDNQKKSGKKGQSQNQVAVQSPSVACVSSGAVDSGISDSLVSETVDNVTNNSAALSSRNAPATPDTLSATGGEISNAVEVKTNCHAEGPASISAERPVAQAFDTMNNHKHDQMEESSQQEKLKEYISGVADENEMSPEGSKENTTDGSSSVGSVALKSTEYKQTEQDAAKASAEVLPSKVVGQVQDESETCSAECDRRVGNETVSLISGSPDQHSADPLEATSKYSKDSAQDVGCGSVSPLVSGTKDKPILEPSKVKTTTKGKRKKILKEADAAGPTSNLYSAYKKPEEKKEAAVSSEVTESSSTSGSLNQPPADAITSGKGGQSKAEPDDWEDAADMSTPKLEVADKSQLASDGSGSTAKKYSRDFLLKFADQCINLPEGFETTEDNAEVLVNANISNSHVESHPSPGRNIDRSGGMSRMDRRGSGVFEEERRSRFLGPSGLGRDIRLDAGFGGNAGFRPGQGSNFGVLRNPRSQAPLLSGPLQSTGSLGGMQRNSPDGERWQRSATFQQRGLIPSPSPQTPLQMMHKAEKKYQVGKISDVEEAKQRQLKAILNKLTPQNFERLFEQVKEVNIDNAVTLTGVISQIFEKALMEPTFCEMYANFCSRLAAVLPDFSEDNERITFRRLLLNKCQEEFERGEREQEEANKADEGEVKQSDEEREEKRIKARRRMLGNIRLIGELYKKKMLTERIMHDDCIKKLLYQDPDEEDIEALCKLMSTIGEMIDQPKAKEHMDAYFERMKLLSTNTNFSARVRFMLRDAIDLRKNKWQQKRKVEGPKKIEEVHRDAAQERQAQAGRLGRGPSNNSSARRTHMDFGPRGSSMLSSPNVQMGGLRGLPTQSRGYGSQDVRWEDRQSYEARTIPLPQRPLGDDSITLGPQGGLARGMSVRGPTTISSSPVSDVPSVLGDSQRMTTGLNGYSNLSERAPYSSREEPRYMPDRFAGPTAYDQSNAQEGTMNYGNRDLRNVDRSFDRPVAASHLARMQGPTVSQNASSGKVWPEERLRDMSMSAIKEYYSASDVKEVASCIKDLNSPSFHPTMVALWVTDSFERKDMERDLLAKLLVNLAKSQDGSTLSQSQLIKGFEAVLSTLEDAVNDAPRAAEFLGRIFAKVITENIISLKEIGRLIFEGGEEPGRLLEVGLAADVLGSTLEVIKLDKGDEVLSEIQSGSALQLETFRPPHPIESWKLEKFI